MKIIPILARGYSRSADTNRLSDWIGSYGFTEFEQTTYKVGVAVSRRVSVYIFHLDCIGKEVVMKVSSIHSEYGALRKLGVRLRRVLRGDHNRKAFEACHDLSQQGIATPVPIAFWQQGTGLSRKTYFMYEKIPSQFNGEEILRQLGADLQRAATTQIVLSKIATIIRRVHECRWRHGDPVPKNFLSDLSNDKYCDEDLQEMSLSLIDFDKSYQPTLTVVPILKTICDMKDLRGLRRFGFSDEQILTAYTTAPSSLQRLALRWW